MSWRRHGEICPPTLLVLAILASRICFFYVQGFAPSSSVLHARHDVLNSRLTAIRNKKPKDDGDAKEKSNVPGYEFFRAEGNSYVPEGISREEYTKLRKGEIEKEMKMNYGAWGPRFKRTGTPDGDWMVMPNLWTAGQVNRPAGKRSDLGDLDDSDGPRWKITLRKLFRILCNNTTAFILAYTLIDCIEIGILMWRWKVDHMNPGKAMRMIVNAILFQRSVLKMTVMKLEAIKLATSVVLAPILNELLEHWNRRHLWSNARSASTIAGASVLLLAIWRSILQFIPFP